MSQWMYQLKRSFHSDRFFLIFKYIVILFILFSVLYIFSRTYSKYTSDVSVQLEPQLAFFIADAQAYQDTLELGKILPSKDPYYYAFTISNFKDDKKANVDLEYQLRIVTTTNLPLQYELYRNTDDYSKGNMIDQVEVFQNEDDMYFQVLQSSPYYELSYEEKRTDTYVLKVVFPMEYQSFPEKYAGPVEFIEIQVDARQKI